MIITSVTERARVDREIAGSHRPTPVTPFGCGRPMVVLRPRARFTASRVELHSNLRNPGRLVNLGPSVLGILPLTCRTWPGPPEHKDGWGGAPSRLCPFAPRAGQNVHTSLRLRPQQLTPFSKTRLRRRAQICRPTPSASCGEPGAYGNNCVARASL